MSAHHEELQEIENVKYYWHKGGKWLAFTLVLASLVYLGNVIYQGQIRRSNEAAAVLANQVKGDVAKLQSLQQSYSKSPAATQASLETAKILFDEGKLDEAASAYRWVLDNQKTPVFQAAAVQNLASVLLQQKKFDDALNVLDTPVEDKYKALILELKGDVFSAQGKNKEALAEYQAATQLLPENSPNRQLIELKSKQM